MRPLIAFALMVTACSKSATAPRPTFALAVVDSSSYALTFTTASPPPVLGPDNPLGVLQLGQVICYSQIPASASTDVAAWLSPAPNQYTIAGDTIWYPGDPRYVRVTGTGQNGLRFEMSNGPLAPCQ